MSQDVKPYGETGSGKKAQVTRMFDNIAGNYDRLNRVITFGIDIRWRKKVVAILKEKAPESILDIATGTGDLALALVKTGAKRIVGLDLAANMLTIGEEKMKRSGVSDIVEMVLGDGENLAFDDNTFDAATVAFGVRNFENLDKGLQEIYRVLKPGGTFVVLETSVPTKTPFKQGYSLYTKTLLPAIGKIFSRDRAAYKYLSDSAAVFPHGQAFNNILSKNGFIGVENRPQTMGVATIYIATK